MKIQITETRWKEFEHYWTISVLKTPTYRYGQAFIGFFHVELNDILDIYDEAILWNLNDYDKIKLLIDKYADIIPD